MSQGNVAQAVQDLEQQLRSELEQREFEIPLLPNVAAEVLSSSLDDNANAGRLAELIQQDQGLASHMLRVVNSPAFRGSAEIVALQQAIARLGMERIREIALTVSLQGTLYTPGQFDSLLQHAWRHALRSGLWSKEVARVVRKNVEMAYICGLLHNVGTPLLVNRIAQIAPEIEQPQIVQLLDGLLMEACVVLVDAWSLPSAVSVCARYLGRFGEAQNAQDAVAVVEAGVYVARCHDEDCLNADDVLAHPAIQHLNFYPDDVERLLACTDQVRTSVESMA